MGGSVSARTTATHPLGILLIRAAGAAWTIAGQHSSKDRTLNALIASWAKNSNWFGGMRPKTLVVAADNRGRAIWVSDVFTSSTLCGVMDVSCASHRRETFSQQFPEAIGHYRRPCRSTTPTTRTTWTCARLIAAIKATGDVAQEIKDQWDRLQP